uniref:acyltransferase-like protein At1g54570, chloroplastic n=1 Tax=Erigeron canadensis TaxID=72917 RepID=UPI001CB966B6|nr:acyltransferase-like protein At1g54570, chloroplastic [Erigeron canadensis]
MILTTNNIFVPHCLALNVTCKSRPTVYVRSLSTRAPEVLVSEPLSHQVVENKTKENQFENLEALWEDGYGSQSKEDFYKLAKEFSKPDGGPPRWFCPVSCGRQFNDSPVLLYLPGLDGLGLGLMLHEKALGKFFEVRSLHIPVQDRTPLEDLIQLVEESVRFEHSASSKKPIYLVGDSFGGCLALAVAARNPTIDLVIILVNPATSFERSRLPTLLFLFEALPNIFHGALSAIYLSAIRDIGDLLTKDTLIWRLKLFQSAATYANSYLHAITAEILVLASNRDKLLPSKDEAQKLAKSLQNCRICILKGNHHQPLLESDYKLMTIIKGSTKYRRSSSHDLVKDYIPPSMSEYKKESEGHWLYQVATSPVMLSTLEDGTIVSGLTGIPNDGPVLFVGNHMLMGLDLFILYLQFLKEKHKMLRGLGHPQNLTLDNDSGIPHLSIWFRVFGLLPVTAINMFKLLSADSYILLYPGGSREALHRKGEVHKIFWPEKQEFVRMAAKFGATIIPFGSIGEDDISEMIADYDDMMKIPGVNTYLEELNEQMVQLRQAEEGEVANQPAHFPFVLPKIPGRFYYLFGKPIKTKGMEKILNDKEISQAMYLLIKSEVEKNIAYLIRKREEDPYRSFLKRVVYQAKTNTPWDKVPTFEI